MTPEQELTARELGRIDPQLEGMFRLGHELALRGASPGLSYALAVLTRELTTGVVRSIAADPLARVRAGELTPEEESHRTSFASVLNRGVDDPLVTQWFDLHKRANQNAHYEADKPSAAAAVSDFVLLSNLLEGRLAPFFAARDEIDAMLENPEPTSDQLRALERLLLRGSLHKHFFQSLARVAWLRPLLDSGLFHAPPMRRRFEGGAWQPVPWPESVYLGRIAAEAPDAVAHVLRGVPALNDNPTVWGRIAEIASLLPRETAAGIVPHLLDGLRAIPFALQAEAYASLIVHIAPADPAAARKLFEALMWIPKLPTPELPVPAAIEEEEGGGLEALHDASLFGPPPWTLTRMARWDAPSFLASTVPALLSSGPREAFTVLLRKTTVAVREVRGRERESVPRASRTWYRDFDDEPDDDDPRALLLHALDGAAMQLVAGSDVDAEWVERGLAESPYDFARRLRDRVVARAGGRLASAVNRILSEDEAIGDDPSEELRELLFRRVRDASTEVRQRIARAIEAGPGEQTLSRYVRNAIDWGEPTTVEKELARWQKRQLNALPGPLPDEFLGIAASIGFNAAAIREMATEVHEFEEVFDDPAQALARVSVPLSVEEFVANPPEETARVILNLALPEGPEGAVARALQGVIGNGTTQAPAIGLRVLEALMRLETRSIGIEAILHGVQRSGTILSDSDLELLSTCVASILRLLPAWSHETQREVLRTVEPFVDAVDRGAAHGRLERIRVAAAEALEHENLWPIIDPPATYAAVVHRGLESPSGLLVDLYLQAAAREAYHRGQSGTDAADRMAKRAPIHETVRETIDAILARPEKEIRGALAAIGSWMWFVLEVDEAWLQSHEPLLRASMGNPLGYPLWLGYLLRGRFSLRAFAAQRPWFLASATTLPPEGDADGKMWEPRRQLATWMILAAAAGQVAPGDADSLLAHALHGARVDSRGHAYWNLWRRRRDQAGRGVAADQDEQDRVIALWQWRCDMLERAGDDDGRADELEHLVIWVDLLPDRPESAFALVTRTLNLGARGNLLHVMWEWLTVLAPAWPQEALQTLRSGLAADMRSEYPRPALEELEPIFKALLASDAVGVREQAIQTLARLVEEDFTEFAILRPAT